jgi:hypothetical protein
MKLYFGHPVNTYDTELEERILAALTRIFPERTIENPNQPHHQEGYSRYKHERRSGMLYFYEEVLPHCDGGVFLPFGDGMWGAGVFGEADFLMNHDKEVWVITPGSLSQGAIAVLKVRTLDDVSALTPEETRSRVYCPEGFRPYA